MGLTPRDYFAIDTFEREQAGLFSRGWIPVCRAADVGEPGALKSALVGATPIIVARARDGAVHALSNVCRHRAMTLIEGEARAEAIRCPYHLWSYALDGALITAPFMDPAAVQGCDLPRYAATEWGGWVFVDLSGDAPPLEGMLAPLSAALDPVQLATLRPGFRIALTHDWNWKVMVENFGESYHHIGAHAGTLQPLWPGGQTDASPSTAHWIDIRHPTHPAAGALGVYVVFPLFLLAVTPASGGAVWYRLVPTGPESIELEIVGLYPPHLADDGAAMARARAEIWAVHQEDVLVCERVQRGLRSPDAILGPLSHLEVGITRFREWVETGLPD
jgi:phenylpropionate dioxygenase-like ring-hydroxylating dioxygenase large terminal subunit